MGGDAGGVAGVIGKDAGTAGVIAATAASWRWPRRARSCRTSGRHGHASRDLCRRPEQTALDVLAQAADRVAPPRSAPKTPAMVSMTPAMVSDETEQELREEVDGVEHHLLEAHPDVSSCR